MSLEFFDNIKINEESRIPKYRQIVEEITYYISLGTLQMGQKIPSINSFSENYYLSRDTVEKAYNILKDRKIIASIKGKGYYIARTQLISKTNVLFLVNKLSTYKMQIYNSFVNAVGINCHTELHIYHCDESLFLNILTKSEGAYDYYIIMSHFTSANSRHTSSTKAVEDAINKIPTQKLILMDNNNLKVKGSPIEIFQDFEEDIYDALRAGSEQIRKYNKLILVYPEKTIYPYPRRILHGFRKFCVEFDIPYEVISEVYEEIVLMRGDLFLTIEESDLVNLVNQIRGIEFVLGEDIGVISYNETPLKDLLGITVVSTDFKAMGETAARMVRNRENGKVKNPFSLINRNSM
jgi:DNA-binding transcriptional regulator YhcF (GntR family)